MFFIDPQYKMTRIQSCINTPWISQWLLQEQVGILAFRSCIVFVLFSLGMHNISVWIWHLFNFWCCTICHAFKLYVWADLLLEPFSCIMLTSCVPPASLLNFITAAGNPAELQIQSVLNQNFSLQWQRLIYDSNKSCHCNWTCVCVCVSSGVTVCCS